MGAFQALGADKEAQCCRSICPTVKPIRAQHLAWVDTVKRGAVLGAGMLTWHQGQLRNGMLKQGMGLGMQTSGIKARAKSMKS